MWKYTGRGRPPFAVPPAHGQESVWDYPRPPRVLADTRVVEVRTGPQLLARSHACLRVLETAAPPTFYIPAGDVETALLVRTRTTSWCEWKGQAVYYALAADPGAMPVAWSYPDPNAQYRPLAACFGFYPARVSCTVDGERVRAQAGGYYGGWITDEIVGPFKGEPGSGHW